MRLNARALARQSLYLEILFLFSFCCLCNKQQQTLVVNSAALKQRRNHNASLAQSPHLQTLTYDSASRRRYSETIKKKVATKPTTTTTTKTIHKFALIVCWRVVVVHCFSSLYVDDDGFYSTHRNSQTSNTNAWLCRHRHHRTRTS